ncbi:MAG: serine hydrolase [Syntrophobacteraceae bacterium]
MKSYIASLIVIFNCVLLAGCCMVTPVPRPAGEPKVLPPLPLYGSKAALRPLEQQWDMGLQQELENKLNQYPYWRSLIREKKMAVGLVDLSNTQAARFARVNGDTMMYAASLPKIGICLAAFYCFQDGMLKETPQIYNDLREMISVSNNEAATRMIDLMGLTTIEAVIMAPQYRFYDPQKGGGLWVGARYARGGQRIPDPLKGLSEAATVTQVCRFYYMLASGKLINPKRSQQMLALFSNPGLHDKFVSVEEKVAPLKDIYRKSGQWGIYHSDSMLVWSSGWRKYILVALVEDPCGESVLTGLVPVVENLLYCDHCKPKSSAACGMKR